MLLTPLCAFVGAALTVTAVYFLGRRQGQIDSNTLLLGGVITASFLSAIIVFLMSTVNSSNTRGMVFWLMGNLSTSFQKSIYWFLAGGFFIAAGVIYGTANGDPGWLMVVGFLSWSASLTATAALAATARRSGRSMILAGSRVALLGVAAAGILVTACFATEKEPEIAAWEAMTVATAARITSGHRAQAAWENTRR